MSSSGFSLLEVLVSLAILSFGLLAFTEAEYVVMQNTRTSFYHNTANQQFNNLIETIYACRFQGKVSPPCVNKEFISWRKELKKLLPKVKSECAATQLGYHITLSWQSNKNAKTKDTLRRNVAI